MASILVTGAGGNIGKPLIQKLISDGHHVKTLSFSQWNKKLGQKSDLLKIIDNIVQQKIWDGVDVAIHLSGASLASKRWTARYKREILDSRVNSTWALFESARISGAKPSAFICMSGVAFYPDPCDSILTEEAQPGEGFLQQVTRDWESTAMKFQEIGSRVILVRCAPVLQAHAGLLRAYLSAAAVRVIPVLGRNSNKLSWIHITDLVNFFAWAVVNPGVSGPFNLASPESTTQKGFVKAIDRALKRSSFHPCVPALLLRIALGEKSVMPLTDQQVYPRKLTEAGFQFSYPEIEAAVQHLLQTK